MARLAVLGLDALPPGYLDSLADSGAMPFYASVRGRVSWYRLHAIPPVTWSVWPSIMSGVDPGWHGVTGFFTVDRRARKSRLMSAADLEHPRIHEIMSMEGREYFMLNPVPDYPLPPARRGVVVSWFMFAEEPLTNRPRVVERYLSGVSKARVKGCGGLDAAVEEHEAYLALLEDHAPQGFELLWVTLRYPDYYFHKCMRAVDEPGMMAPLFRVLDRMLRVLWEHSDSVVIVSDHGFARFRRQVSVNDILARHGLAAPGERVKQPRSDVIDEDALAVGEVTSRIYVPTWFYKLVKATRADGLARAVLSLAGKLTGRRISISTGYDVDLARSRAALLHTIDYGVYVFEGDPGEVARVLSGYEGLRVSLAREVYRGPYAVRAPDIVVVPDFEGGYVLSSRFIKGVVYSSTTIASHSHEGVLGVAGEAAELARRLAGEPGSVVEPTLPGALALCTLGLPLPAQSPHAGRCGAGVRDYAARWRAAKRVWAALSGRRGRGG